MGIFGREALISMKNTQTRSNKSSFTGFCFLGDFFLQILGMYTKLLLKSVGILVFFCFP